MTHTPLTETEARMLTAKAVTTANALAYLLKELHDRQVWKVLGYPSFKAYIEDNFEPSLSTIYRMMRRERARDALSECVNLTRFTNGALEALAGIDDDHIRTVAEIAAQTETGDIGVQAVKAVQAAITETLVTGTVVDGDGNQYKIDDVMADGARGTLREAVLSKRRYLVGNEPARVIHFTATTITITVDVYTMDIYHELNDQAPVNVSIWREQ
jgi:hypothetical protein